MDPRTLELNREQLQDVLPHIHASLRAESDARAKEMIASGHKEWECKYAEAEAEYRRRNAQRDPS